MSLTSSVGHLHTQDEYKRSIVWACQIITNQAAYMVFDGNKAKTKGADKVRDQEYEDENASSILEAIVEVDACQDRDSNDKAVWNLFIPG